jgi:hypothetical protein
LIDFKNNMPIKVYIKGSSNSGKTLFLEGPIRRRAPRKIDFLRDVARYHTNDVLEIVFLHVYFHELSEAFLEALKETLTSRMWNRIDFKYCTGLWTRPFLEAFARYSKHIRILGSTEDSNLYRAMCAAAAATSDDPDDFSVDHLQLQTLFQEYSILSLKNSLADNACRLKELTLRECSFQGGLTLSTLAAGLRQNQGLKRICFMDCRFRDSAKARLLWEALAGHSNLEHFSLIHSDVSISVMDGLNMLARSCEKLKNLKICHLPVKNDHRIQQRDLRGHDDRAEAVVGTRVAAVEQTQHRGGWWLESLEIHTMHQLEVLDLSKNWMYDDAAHYLAESAPLLPRVRQLYLGVNHIGDLGIQSLATSLLTQHWPNLKVMDISNNLFGNVGASSLLEALKRHTNLETLHGCHGCDCSTELSHLTHLNRAGRRLWTSSANAPLGLWPLVLEQVDRTNPTWNEDDKASVLYSMLRLGSILFP